MCRSSPPTRSSQAIHGAGRKKARNSIPKLPDLALVSSLKLARWFSHICILCWHLLLKAYLHPQAATYALGNILPCITLV